MISGDSSHLEEAMWQMTLQSSDEMDLPPVPFPERPGEPDCVYYIRTGLCGFGMSCRFNHPPNRKLAAALSRDQGEYPERIGQPECQYFLKTGTCKFGSTCKYHHPRERAGSFERVTVNIVGLPLRPVEKDCAYYMRTGLCKFGITCKFNHPQPATFRTLVAMSGSSMYTSTGSPSTTSPQPFPTALPSWPLSPTPYIQGSGFQSPSSFAPLIVSPRGLVSMPGWNTYQAGMGPVASWDGQHMALGASFVYGAASPTNVLSGGVHASYNPYMPGSAPSGLTVMQMHSTGLSRDSDFPERPGVPECQYFMKTGDCKFRKSCRYHHPRERISSMQNSILSPMGLPLRPGVPQCAFYTRYGICKFGPTCKFDHPMSSLVYSPSASSLADMPISPAGFSVATLFPPLSGSIEGTKSIMKESISVADEQKAYENSDMNDCTGEQPSNSIRLAAASVNRLSNADSAEPRTTASQVSMDSST